MKLKMFDLKEYVSEVAVSSIKPAVGCIVMAMAIKHSCEACQDTSYNDIYYAALKTGVAGGSFIILSDLACRLYEGMSQGKRVQVELPGGLNRAASMIFFSSTFISMFTGAFEAQTDECRDSAWNIVTPDV